MAIDGKRGPIGIELVRRGVVSEGDINKAIDYQRGNPGKKIGDVLYILGLANPITLIEAIGDILGEKGMILKPEDININISEYISSDVMKQNKAVPFDISGGKVKVCFPDTANRQAMETVRLLFLNKGLVMDRYITFESIIKEIIDGTLGKATDNITATKDITEFIDTVIKTAITKRASDIHIEPLENQVRVRYRIDGELITAVTVEKEKQAQIIGRLKAISNMHQEKQEAQDGRIITYPSYNIRVSSQKNIYGEKFVLRLLKKDSDIKDIFDLGFPGDQEFLKQCFNKRNSISIIAAPTGEGKTTSLYSIMDYLDRPEINITTIEDPVEIRITGLNQIEVDPKTSFSGSLRTVLRQDPDIILVGEIRDTETAEISMQAGQTGHYVLSTIHTIDSIEVITRLRKMGISDYDIASTLATTISQRLVRKLCPKCSKERDFNDQEKQVIESLGKRYNMEFDLKEKKTYDAIGCKECNDTGYYDRIGIFEVLRISDTIRELLVKGSSSIDIKKAAIEEGYKPLVVDGVRESNKWNDQFGRVK